MLSRLISLLRRLPAVNWLFNRLRPLPHERSIEVAPAVTGSAPVAIADIAPAPALEASVGTGPSREDDGVVIAVPAREEDTDVAIAGVPVMAAGPSTAPQACEVSAATAVEPSIDSTPAACEATSVAPAAIADEAEGDAEPVVSEAPAEPPADVEPAIAPVIVETEAAPLDVVARTDHDESSASSNAEPIPADDAPVALVEAREVLRPEALAPEALAPEALASEALAPEALAAEASDTRSGGDEPVPPAVIAIAPAPAIAVPVMQIRSAPKPRAKLRQPADRAALIRQRWAESGIRMWNPRLHGTGEAALNIQGSVELLPPAAGETMPRYDKLEFRMLGGQIVCEGVIVEAPAPASQRSFTRLTEPRAADRVREPARARQAALA